MSYAIVRNEKLTRDNAKGSYVHNERTTKVPDIKDIKLIKLNKEKVENEIIKPKDDVIMKLYQDILKLQKELLKQVNLVNKIEKYQKERDKIIVENINIKYNPKEIDIEWKYKNKIKVCLTCKIQEDVVLLT